MLHLTKVHHIAIICSDYRRSLDFYTRILGMRVIAEHYREERQSYKTDLALGDDYVVELFSFPSPPARLSHPEAAGLRHIAFQVSNLQEAIAELEKNEVLHEAVRIDEFTGKQFVFFADPDGLPIELYQS
ncbi:MAG: VOC family protein [Paludibacteraceae bacterium]|nr:VOC family protein [Paludibacteraceae bacterium]